MCKIIQQKYEKVLTEIHINGIVNIVHGKEGEIQMANVELFRKKIKDSGMTISAIASKAGISRETLYNRMKSGNFYASEIASLTKVLCLSRKERDEIFLP